MTKKPITFADIHARIMLCDIEPNTIAPNHTLVIRYERELGLSIRFVPAVHLKKSSKTSPV